MTNPITTTVTRTWTCVLFDLDGTLTDSAPGITSSLARMFAALGRPVPSPAQLLEYVGPAQYFDVITGATEDESRSAKADVVAEALRRLEARGTDLDHTVMVGDRQYDVEGAAAHG